MSFRYKNSIKIFFLFRLNTGTHPNSWSSYNIGEKRSLTFWGFVQFESFEDKSISFFVWFPPFPLYALECALWRRHFWEPTMTVAHLLGNGLSKTFIKRVRSSWRWHWRVLVRFLEELTAAEVDTWRNWIETRRVHSGITKHSFGKLNQQRLNWTSSLELIDYIKIEQRASETWRS